MGAARPVGLLMAGVAVTMLGTAGVGLLMGSWEGAVHMALSATAVGVLSAVSLWAGRNTELQQLDRRQALLVVSLSWGALCVVGGLPFIIGADFTLAEAIFESTSGFTTTGATVLPEIRDRLNPALHFWRMLSHWLGGMGIVVLFVAVFPALGVGGKHLFRSEVPGPKSKGLSPRIRETSSVLWKLYVGITLLEIALLLPFFRGALPDAEWRVVIFEATVHAFSTMGTGGFSTFNGSVGELNSWAIECIVLVFMVIAGMNFGLFHETLRRGPGVIWRDTQTRVYLAILAVVSVLCAISIFRSDADIGPLEALRHSSFMTASVMTTTGYGNSDFETWPTVTRMLLLGLYFTGACSGSTAGGMKLIRVVALTKAAWSELKKSFRPHLVAPVRVGRSAVGQDTLVAIMAFLFLYVATVAVGAVWVAWVDRTDGTTAMMASLACVSNVGPGFGAVGPTDNFGFLSGPTHVVLSFLMLLGRLEFLTVLALFTPVYWRR